MHLADCSSPVRSAAAVLRATLRRRKNAAEKHRRERKLGGRFSPALPAGVLVSSALYSASCRASFADVSIDIFDGRNESKQDGAPAETRFTGVLLLGLHATAGTSLVELVRWHRRGGDRRHDGITPSLRGHQTRRRARRSDRAGGILGHAPELWKTPRRQTICLRAGLAATSAEHDGHSLSPSRSVTR